MQNTEYSGEHREAENTTCEILNCAIANVILILLFSLLSLL